MGKPNTTTTKETLTIEYYCDPASDTYRDWNKSYLRAGYSECGGYTTNARKVFQKKRIQARIVEINEELHKHIDVSRGEIINKLKDMAGLNSPEHEAEKESDRIASIKLISQIKGLLVDVTKDISDQQHLLTPAQQIEASQKQIKLVLDANNAGTAVAS